MRIDQIELSGSLFVTASASIILGQTKISSDNNGSISFTNVSNPTQKVIGSYSGSFTGSIKLPTVPQGAAETNILLVNGSGNVVYRSNLSLTGAQGTQGFQGTQGTQGIQGTQGTQGIQGTVGTQGFQGFQGFQGTAGTNGAQGTQGIQGTAGTNGAQGNQGATGLQGTVGTQGFQGNQGAQGNQGIQGIQGTVGTQGFQGNQGAQGNQGIQGTVGTQGFQGRQGPQGNQGSTGVQGTNGTVGTQGFQGNQGFQGTQGIRGASDWTPNFSGGVIQSTTNSNTYTKSTGNTGWDGQVYSTEGYSRGVYCSAKSSQTTGYIMFGLNSDPTTNGSYDTIDFAWYLNVDGDLRIYENGTNPANAGTYTTSTVLSITYDGYNVRYWKDGVIQRTVARAIGVPLYFDSSFYNIGASLNSVAFGPMGESGVQGATGIQGGTGPQGAAGPVNVYSVTFDASYITPPVDYTITHNLGLSGNFKNIVITVHGIVYGAARLYYGSDFIITSYSSNSFVFRLQTGNWNTTQTVSISLVRA